jgi:V-type H+-transporting ATPase subunit C
MNLLPTWNCRGNLSTKSLVGIVSKEDVVVDSEYLETLLVAVPKYVGPASMYQMVGSRLVPACADRGTSCYCSNLVRDWKEKYERLTTMVVPRSSS